MTIKFKRQVNFMGRNGFFKSTGLDVLVDRQRKIVTLSPITSKGMIGNCAIEVPLEAWGKMPIFAQRAIKRFAPMKAGGLKTH